VQIAATPAERTAKSTSAARAALVVATAHGLNDAYASFVPPLLPRIMDDLGLSIALAATLAVTFSFASSLPQPIFGYLADRYGRRLFAVLGPVVAGVFVASIGFAHSFWLLVALLTIAGVGSAAFHPPGASYAVRVTEGKGGGARYSIFAFGGSVGFAIGPLVAVALAQWQGMAGLWMAMLPALVLAPLIYAGLPSGRGEVAANPRLPPSPATVLRHLKGPLGLIFGISATMAFVQRTFLTMEPIIVADRGGSETLGAVVLTVYLGAQAFGTVMGGVLADRMDRRTLLVRLCVWALPAHLLAIWIGPSGALGLVAAACAGFLGMATLPPIVVMAQEMLPNSTGVGSGIVMGLAWAAGSLAVLGTGTLADFIGPRTATLASMPIILLAVLFASHGSLRQSAGEATPTEA
jgi:FSR family fosmidomycin resistance protein-like MFS transporter